MILFCSDLGCHLRYGDETFASESWTINVLTFVAGFSKYSAGYKSSLANCAGMSKFCVLCIVNKNSLCYNQNLFHFFAWVAHLFFSSLQVTKHHR